MRTLKVGTRKSMLALTQTQWVMEQLKTIRPDLSVHLEKIVTKGDKILEVTLSKVGGKGLFVKEIEQALLDGRIDLAVHSMKDLPGEMPKGLVIGSIPVRENPCDSLLSKEGCTLDQLPAGAVVGTSSLRRQAQLLAYRPDLKVKSIRGNLDTRINKMKEGSFDAILLAQAGLSRMGWQEKATEIIPMEIMLPAVGQGALAVQCRADDHEVLALIREIHDEKTALAVTAERAFLHAFEGSCHLPLAAFGEVIGDEVRLTGLVAHPDGSKVIKGRKQGRQAKQVGLDLVSELKQQGAGQLLSEVREGFVEWPV